MPASPDFSGWNCVADERPVLDRREERLTVVAPGEHRLRERRLDVEQPLLRAERVHEVEALVLDAAEERRALAGLDGVPAHVRQDRRVELGHDARPLAEALGVDAALDAALEQHLHADADAEHRASAGEPPLDELVAAARAQRLHDGAEGADTRDDQPVGLEHERRGRRSAARRRRRRRAP